jgi:hypothetical protein
MSVSTGDTLPVSITTSVTMTITAATIAMQGIIDRRDACRAQFGAAAADS